MIKTLIKYYIADQSISILFERVTKNFSSEKKLPNLDHLRNISERYSFTTISLMPKQRNDSSFLKAERKRKYD